MTERQPRKFCGAYGTFMGDLTCCTIGLPVERRSHQPVRKGVGGKQP